MGIYYGDIHYGIKISKKVKIEDNIITMNLSKRSHDKELFSGERSSKENTMNLSKQSHDKEIFYETFIKENREPIYEIKFDDNSISLNDYLDKIKNIYLNLLEPHKYRYELFVDISTTYDSIQVDKGWQIITAEQMIYFISGMYKINYLNE